MSRGWLIFIGVIAFFGITIGVFLIKGYTFKEALFNVLQIENSNTSEPKTSKVTRRNIGIVLICASIILSVAFVWGSLALPNKSSSSTVTCQVCHRSFNKGSDNAKSIARSNMCENCHDNFEWRQEVQDHIDNQPVN